MNIWQLLVTTFASIGLMEIVSGKEVTTPEGVNLGVAADVEMDNQGNTWIVVKEREQWGVIPGN